MSKFAITLITRGLMIPFINKGKVDKLCKKHINTRRSTRKNSKILRTEIKSLIEQGVIEEVTHSTPLFENYIFAKQKPNGKFRIIFDMKVLNTYIKLPKLKMFKFSMAYRSFHANNFACSIDLSNAFWHIGVHESFKKYLAFRFNNTS